MNDLRIQLRLLTEARRDRLFVLARSEGVSPSDWLRGAIDRARKGPPLEARVEKACKVELERDSVVPF